MTRVAVVLRQLPGCNPVVCAVVEATPHTIKSVDNLDKYLESRANEIISDFKNKLVEFKGALFYITITETEG